MIRVQGLNRPFQPFATPSLPSFDRHRQTVDSPEPFNLLMVHTGPSPTEGFASLATAFPRMSLRVLFQRFDHIRIVLLFRPVPQHRPAQTGQLTATSLRNPSGLQCDRRIPTLTDS